MRIRVLGAGGAVSEGIAYNSFVIDGCVLCEAPPDIMVSLGGNSIGCAGVSTVFISHFHGDHCFGLPFLLLNLFYHASRLSHRPELRIIAPRGIGERAHDLLALSLGEGHPCLPWSREICRFVEIEDGSTVDLLSGCTASFFRTEHFAETYGFLLSKDESPRFAYVPDTLWCPSVARILSQKPPAVLIDLNGERDDPVPVHLSESDLIEHALPLTGDLTRYYGTHLKKHKRSALPLLSYAREGMELKI